MPAESGPSSSSTETGKSPVISTPDLKPTADRGIAKTESGLLVVKEDPTNVDPKDSALSAARGVGMREKGLGSIKYPDKLSAEELKEKQIEEGPTDWIDWNDRRVKGGGSGNNNGGGNIPSGEGGDNGEGGGNTPGGEVVIDGGGIDGGGPTPGGEGGGDNGDGGEVVIDGGGIDGGGPTPGGEGGGDNGDGGGNTPGGEGGGNGGPEGPPVYGPGVGDAYDPVGGDGDTPERHDPPEVPVGPTPEEAREALLPIRANLEDAIKRLAKAKDRNDSIFSRMHRKNEFGLRDKEELEAASENLKNAFAEYTRGLAGVIAADSAPLNAEIAQITAQLNSGDLSPQDAARLAGRFEQLAAQKRELELNAVGTITQEMMAARSKVDAEQLAIKESKKGGRFVKWFRKNWTTRPGLRAVVSGGLFAAGALGAATGIAPLALGSFALRRVIATAGAYAGIEGAGRWGAGKLASRDARKTAEARVGSFNEAERGYADALSEQAAGRNIEVGAEALSAEQRAEHQAFIQEHYREIFTGENSLIAALRGQVDPAAVTENLLEDRLARLRKESDRIRRTKYVALTGAALVAGASWMQYSKMHAPNPDPGPGAPGPGSQANQLDKDFFQGIADHHGPSTGRDWANLLAAGPGKAQMLWGSNPAHAMVASAFDNGGWKDQLQALPFDKQRIAARLIGQQFDASTLSPQSVTTIVEALK